MSEGFSSDNTESIIVTSLYHKCENEQTQSDRNGIYVFIAIYGIVVMLYTWGICHAIKVQASNFVKVVESLILLSGIHLLTFWIQQAAVDPCQQEELQQWVRVIYCVGIFFQQEALLLFSVQYLKAAFWLNDRCHLRVQNKYDNIAILLTIVISIFNLATCEFGNSFDRDYGYNPYIILRFLGDYSSLIIFIYALKNIRLTIRKYGRLQNLQLNSCQMGFHGQLLLIQVFLPVQNIPDTFVWMIVQALVELSVPLSLLFIMYRFPNESSEMKTHCSILNREVPVIVMLQNRVAYAKYMQEQEIQALIQERNERSIMEQAEENLRNYQEDSHKVESIISNVFMTQSVQIDPILYEQFQDPQSQDNELYYNRLSRRNRSIDYNRQELAFEQQLLTSELDDRNSL